MPVSASSPWWLPVPVPVRRRRRTVAGRSRSRNWRSSPVHGRFGGSEHAGPRSRVADGPGDGPKNGGKRKERVLRASRLRNVKLTCPVYV